MKIGEIAQQTGVGIDTIRYYERRGLVKAARQPSGYRAFNENAVERIRFARELQALGLSLDEVATVLADIDRGIGACAEMPPSFEAALTRIDQKLAELRATRRRLMKTAEECRNGRCLLAERAGKVKGSSAKR